MIHKKHGHATTSVLSGSDHDVVTAADIKFTDRSPGLDNPPASKPHHPQPNAKASRVMANNSPAQDSYSFSGSVVS